MFRAGFLLFPELTQLDLTGPYEVLARLPGAKVELVAATREAVRTEHGLTLLPTADYETCPPLDLICVPGGYGVNALMEDEAALAFVRRAAGQARYVMSVCTGSLVLGAAGLLQGRRAASHWLSRELLSAFGAEPVAERTVIDGAVMTGGGVTAGIDLALRVAAEIAGEQTARWIQLWIEYDPQPPFDAGSPEAAGPALVQRVRAQAAPRMAERQAIVARAAERLGRRLPSPAAESLCSP